MKTPGPFVIFIKKGFNFFARIRSRRYSPCIVSNLLLTYRLDTNYNFYVAFNVRFFFRLDERVGNLMFVLKSSDNINNVKMNIAKMINNIYLNPPNHGVQTVFKILTDSVLYNEW